ncbi:fungal specific transcription factor protein [Rutstroemia sp. NJR-2017a BVV2]|nr:fungal specific transcription factor protein [Rutstroemia sp. NJR-2017a BVV2]
MRCCAYDTIRRKSGPKRGYVKALEERLKQVETMLKTQDPPTKATNISSVSGTGIPPVPAPVIDVTSPAVDIDSNRWRYNNEAQPPLNGMNFTANMGIGMGIEDNTFTWEMIGLGIEEPLPIQEVVDELHQIYFDKIHPSLPMIHKYRYLAAMNLAPNQRPPVALRYAMWTHAASVSDKYTDLKEHFYQRARKYIELDTLKGYGEHMISVAHAQAHTLLASYEFKMMYFPRAWMSTGAAIRLCQIQGWVYIGLMALAWMSNSVFRHHGTGLSERKGAEHSGWLSVKTGWPMVIEERDILSDLPASEEAFEMNKPERTQSLNDAMSPSGASKLSSFAGVVLMACLFGRNLIHLHRPDDDDRDNDLNGAFWKRHRQMDNILLNTSLSLPFHLRLPHGIANSNIVFANMNIHSSTICLHQAAIYKAEQNRLPSSISAESKIRAITAANEIASIMRMISHMDLSSMNPFICFCLYVAARVFVQYLKSRPKDSQTADSLRFLLSAMNALKKKNPLTESFLVQLDVDLEALGMRDEKYKEVFGYDADYLGLSSAKSVKIGTNSSGAPNANACTFLRFSKDVPVGIDEPTAGSGQNTTDAASGDAPTSGRTDSFPPNFGPEQTNWNSLNGQSRSQGEGPALVVGQGMPIARDMNNNYGTEGSSTGGDSGLSPNAGPSNQPTPNSSTASDPRPSNLPHNHKSANTRSFEVSSGSHTASQVRSMAAWFNSEPDYNNIPPTGISGMTPGPFNVPETPGRSFASPGGWSMNGQQQSTGLTPVGEGVFRHMMDLGPMDPMEMEIWEGST